MVNFHRLFFTGKVNVYAVEWVLLSCDKMAKKLIFEELNFSIVKEEIILIVKFDVESQIKGYHIYMNQWTPEIVESLKTCLRTWKCCWYTCCGSGKRRSNSWTSKQKKLRAFCKNCILFSTCKQWKYMSSSSSREKGQLRRKYHELFQFSGEEKHIKILKNSLPC